MKTAADIALFLKRNDKVLTLSYDKKADKFSATVSGFSSTSKFLDDALENVAEEIRRQQANMQSVRVEENKVDKGLYPVCPTCRATPIYYGENEVIGPLSSPRYELYCNFCHKGWIIPVIADKRILFRINGNIKEAVFDAYLKLVWP